MFLSIIHNFKKYNYSKRLRKEVNLNKFGVYVFAVCMLKAKSQWNNNFACTFFSSQQSIGDSINESFDILTEELAKETKSSLFDSFSAITQKHHSLTQKTVL